MSASLPPPSDDDSRSAAQQRHRHRHRYSIVLIAIAAALVAIAVLTVHSLTDGPAAHDTPTNGAAADGTPQAGTADPAPGARCIVPTAAPARPTAPLAGLSAPCLGGSEMVDLGQFTAGRVTLINFWASWCGTCREEMPILSRYAQQPAAVQILGINVRDIKDYAQTFATDLNLMYPNVIDADGAISRALQLPPLLPLSFLVRPDGTVQRIIDPLVFRSEQDIANAITRAQQPTGK